MIPLRIGCLSMSRNIVISSPGVLLHQSISHRSIRLPYASCPWQFAGIERRQMEMALRPVLRSRVCEELDIEEVVKWSRITPRTPYPTDVSASSIVLKTIGNWRKYLQCILIAMLYFGKCCGIKKGAII